MKKTQLARLLAYAMVFAMPLTSCSANSASSTKNAPVSEADEKSSEDTSVSADAIAFAEAAMLSEADILHMLEDRGFKDTLVTTSFDTDGNGTEPVEVTSSDARHPVYEANYVSPNGMVWVVSVTLDSIMANPISYNMKAGDAAMTVLVERDSFIQYDETARQFITQTLSESSYIIRKADRIDADTLSAVTQEDLSSDQ